MKFYDAQLESYREGFQQDLKGIDDELVLFENFYSFLELGNNNEALSQLSQITGSKYYETAAAIQSRETSFTQIFGSTRAASIVKTQEQTNRLKLFYTEWWLTIPSILYMGGFVVVAIKKVKSAKVQPSFRKKVKKENIHHHK